MSLSQLRKQAEHLEPDNGLSLTATSDVAIIFESGNRVELPRDLAKKIFGSVENLEKVRHLFDGTECLELHDVKVSDDVWMKLDEVFAMVDEV